MARVRNSQAARTLQLATGYRCPKQRIEAEASTDSSEAEARMPVPVELALCAPRWARTASSSGSVSNAVRLAVVVVVGYIIVR